MEIGKLKLVGVALVVLGLAGCKTTRYTPPQMQPGLQKYLTESDFKAMTGANGRGGGFSYGWAWGHSSVEQAIAASKKSCRKQAVKNMILAPCKLHYVGDKKVGDLSETEIQQIINDYNNAKGTEKSNSITNSSDKTLCNFAISTDKKPSWETKKAWLYAVSEAKSRSLTPEKCANLLGRSELPSSVSSSTSATVKASSAKYNLRGSWEGVSENIQGTFSSDKTTVKGKLQIRLTPSGQPCVGQWMWAKGEYDTSNPPQGTWSIACGNGKAASGTYKSFKIGEGIIEGLDNSGKKISMYFN
jgi:hypothetical protein